MLLQHYFQLLSYYRRWVVGFVLLVTLLVAAMSSIRLYVSPEFTAAADVTILPSQAELAFGREATGGPGPTARSLTATYMEYLKSRPVVATALEEIVRESATEPTSTPQDPGSRILARLKELLRRAYTIVDTGRYMSTDPHERELRSLLDAIQVARVEDAYILRIQVTLDNPEMAARVANSLAKAYVNRASQQLADVSDQVDSFIDQQIQLREGMLDDLLARQRRLQRRDFTASSLADERDLLMRSRSAERTALVQAQIELESAELERQALQDTQDLARSGRSLTAINEARSLAEARYEAARRSVELRKENLRNLTRSLTSMSENEEPLQALQRQRATIVSELAELQSRKLQSDLNQSMALTHLRVVNPAVAPLYPSSPRRVRDTLVAFVVSLFAALAGLVASDTLSGTVKTSVDLDRIVPGRSLGRLPRRGASRRALARAWSEPQTTASSLGLRSRGKDSSTLAKPPGEASPRGEYALRKLGDELERRMILHDSLAVPTVFITGLAEANDIRDAAAAIGAALAGQRESSLSVTITDAHGAPPIRFAPGGTPMPEAEGLTIHQLPRFSARTNLVELAHRSSAIIFVLPAGVISERSLAALCERSVNAGLTATFFALLPR